MSKDIGEYIGNMKSTEMFLDSISEFDATHLSELH